MYEEIWKDIEGYKGLYQISNFGRVKSFYKFKILKSRPNGKGYLRVHLSNNFIVTDYYIHRLVAQAFILNPNNYHCINHIDGNKSNNHYKNLEWCSYSENNQHSYDIGLKKSGEEHYRSKLSNNDVKEMKNLSKLGWKSKDIAKKFNVIRGICR